MQAVTPSISAAPPAAGHAGTSRHIRGSSLLLIGRVLSVALGFVIQVATVRYLSRSDYGAFAYALSVVALGSSATMFCLDKTLARLLPIYDERGDHRRIQGAVVLSAGMILALGLGLGLLFSGLQSWIGRSFIRDPQALAL